MADLIFYKNLLPQYREYALISVVMLEEVIETGLPLGQRKITRSKKNEFKGRLPMLRVILAAIKEGRFVGPDWMNPFELQMAHYPEQIPNLPEPPTFSSDTSMPVTLSDDTSMDEFEPEVFDVLPLAQSTPRHRSPDVPQNWSPIYSFSEATSMEISYADSTIEESITILMNDTINSMDATKTIEPSRSQSFDQKVLEFSFNSGYSCHRSDLMSPTSPPHEWVDKTMEIQLAE